MTERKEPQRGEPMSEAQAKVQGILRVVNGADYGFWRKTLDLDNELESKFLPLTLNRVRMINFLQFQGHIPDFSKRADLNLYKSAVFASFLSRHLLIEDTEPDRIAVHISDRYELSRFIEESANRSAHLDPSTSEEAMRYFMDMGQVALILECAVEEAVVWSEFPEQTRGVPQYFFMLLTDPQRISDIAEAEVTLEALGKPFSLDE